MYLKKVHIQNIRSIADLIWQVDEDNAAGWHVILGDNGAGKTSIMRSIALALVGQERAYALRQNWNVWLRYGEIKGQVKLNLLHEETRDRISSGDEEENNSSLGDVVINLHQRKLVKETDKINEFPSVTINFAKKNSKSHHRMDWGQGQV